LTDQACGHGFEVRDIVPVKELFGKRLNSKKANKNRGFSAFLGGQWRLCEEPYILGLGSYALRRFDEME